MAAAGLRLLGAVWLFAALLLRLGAAAAAAGQAAVAAVDGRRAIAATGEDFVCATLDWWPPDKCDYGTCAWGRAGLLNLVSGEPGTGRRGTSPPSSIPVRNSWWSKDAAKC
jgi:heparanase